MRIGKALVLAGFAAFAAACGDDLPDGACTDGETRACYTGPEGTEGVGACRAGLETCVNGEFPGICIGDITPFVENCNGLDDDCNGELDDASGTGNACNNADDCEGVTACVGAAIGCVGPDRNECGVCGGVAVADLGTSCVLDNCPGELVCNLAGDDNTCDAPPANECGLCGGPVIVGLALDCTAASGCAGLNVCDAQDDGVTCDCNPRPGECRLPDMTFRAVVAPVAGDLVITEVMPDPSGNESLAEWIEVEVKTAVDLNELGIDRVSDSRAPDLIQSVNCLRVEPGDRLIFARSSDPLENGNLPFVTGEFGFPLLAGSVANPGDVQLLSGATVIDAMTWTDSTANTALQLDLGTLDHVSNDSENNLCDAIAPYNGGNDFGTPGGQNRVCPPLAGECLGANGFRRPIDSPAVGELVITEIMPNPSGNDALQEWFEIAALASFDLNDLQLDRVDDTTNPNTISSQTCLSLTAGAHAIFAKNADPGQNGNLPAPAALFTFAMVAGSVASPTTIRVALAGNTIDSVTWTASAADRALQLDPDSTSSSANDVEANFCNATVAYNATDFGTPGLANPQCVFAGECIGASGIRPIVKPAVGQLVITEFFANPAGTGTDNDQEWFEIFNTGGEVDLNELGLKGTGVDIDVIASQTCLPLAANSFALFARTTDPQVNGGLPAVDATFTSFGLAASNGSISLLNGAIVIDQTTWTTPSVPDGVSRQLDPSLADPSVANDVQTNFCDAAIDQIYGSVSTNFGTPKDDNVCN